VSALRDRQRKRQQREQENLKLSSAFEAFITTCEEPWDELMRTGAAFGGSDLDFIETVKCDVLQILHSILVSSGEATFDSLEQLCLAVFAKLEPEKFPAPVECGSAIRFNESEGVSVPIAVKSLSFYGKILKQSGSFDAIAASTYHSLVIAASECFPYSRPLKIVKDSYLDLLNPYLRKDGREGHAGRSTSSGSKSASGTECEKCVKGYQLLDLPFGASKGEVKQKEMRWLKFFTVTTRAA